MLEDDPVLGKFIANYPGVRWRLLLQGGLVYAFATVVLDLVFASQDSDAASIVVIGILAALALVIGWYIAHLWNREVILYARGFSYREGSNNALFRFEDIVSVRQRAETLRYFGLVRRTVYRFTLTTNEDEIITLNNVYLNVGELGARLDLAVKEARRPVVMQTLAEGGRVAFGDTLAVSASGLHSDGRDLPWEMCGGYRLENRKLVIVETNGTPWTSLPLAETDNITLLLDLLREKTGQGGPAPAGNNIPEQVTEG